MLSWRIDYKKLVRFRPAKITGRHMYVRDLTAVAAEKRKAGHAMPRHVNKQMWKSHNRVWRDQVSQARKREYDTKAFD